MNFKIESGVPYSAAKPRTGAADVIAKMKVGDSFIVPKTDSARTSVYNAIKTVKIYMNNPTWEFRSRMDGDHYRFWRIA